MVKESFDFNTFSEWLISVKDRITYVDTESADEVEKREIASERRGQTGFYVDARIHFENRKSSEEQLSEELNMP